MAFPSPSKFESTNEPEGKAIVQAFQLLSYAIGDETVSRRDLYMSCLETSSKAAAHIALLTRQKRQGEVKNRFLQKDLRKSNERICSLQRLLEEPKKSAASPDGKYDPTRFSNNSFIHNTLAAHPIHNELL
ncbi:hypothetical protein EYF80_062519 [Liparis tanakae]|uniref:Uncharacterized protein n=1 Tax=Liparis tanakae TaxID=230148 RepID=A0A4Z2EEM9_9TELE|nr:hypothetical protein EYF80_062519 [Liparis tanakae]